MKKKLGAVTAFKVGPDFIDPGHHAHITGVPGRNLDGWMLDKATNLACFHKHAASSPFSVVEGVMGLFDGYDGKSDAGSTAQMAKWLGLPVVLVVNAKSMARSAAALVQGFAAFDPALSFSGVIFNQVGSERHLAYLKEAMATYTSIKVWGGIPRTPDIVMPERHLGLVTSDDFSLSGPWLDCLAGLIEAHVDLDGLISAAGEVQKHEYPPISLPPKRVRIGVARDRAFCFYYEDNLDLLRAAGADLICFSPIDDPELPHDLDGLYLGGGYPELCARELSHNKSMRAGVRRASQKGMPIYGECGGFMYIGDSLEDQDGREWPMGGILAVKTRMLGRLKALGYREVTFTSDTILGAAGQRIRGHEFHYSEMVGEDPDAPCVFHAIARDGSEKGLMGMQKDRTLGSYFHAHFGSRPNIAAAFVRSAERYRKEREDDKNRE